MEPKQNLEVYLERVHKERDRFREMMHLADIPPIGELSKCDDSPPMWKDVPLQPRDLMECPNECIRVRRMF